MTSFSASSDLKGYVQGSTRNNFLNEKFWRGYKRQLHCRTLQRYLNITWTSMVYDGFVQENDSDAHDYLMNLSQNYVKISDYRAWDKIGQDFTRYLVNRTCEALSYEKCKATLKAGKKAYRDKVLQSIPEDVMKKILKIYEADFKLFNYKYEIE